MSDFSSLDIILIIALGLLTLRGFLRGFVKEFFSLGAFVLGILSAFLFCKTGAEFIRSNYLDMKGLPEVLAFVIIFFLVFIICKIIQKILDDVIQGMNLSGLDKLLGGILGLAEGVIVVCVILFVMAIQPVFDTSGLLLGSLFGNILLPLIIG